MVALYRGGRQVDALALYREVRGTLIGELGVEPGVNLRDAEWLILSHQLDAEESGPADRSQVLSLPGLPTYRDRYVSDGRCADALGRALRTAGPVSVTGTGGIGKTRLVVETLAMLREEWTRDAGFCSLSHVRDADGVAGAVAAALGVRIPPRSDPVRAIAHDLAKGRCVLVLDTCEHVADAVVTLIGELCRRCPALTVVATSRVPLKMDDGAVVEVTTLEPATAGVALFVDRAGRAEPNHAMADTELATIEALCARLDGLPLAIELAAARSRTFSPHELLDRLDRRLALLHDPLGRSDDRHASLRSTFQWSYDALQPVEQHVFRILGAFAAPTDLQAVEEVAFTPGDPAAGLAGLVEQSLVVARRRAGRTQFTQLDSLRAYATRSCLSKRVSSTPPGNGTRVTWPVARTNSSRSAKERPRAKPHAQSTSCGRICALRCSGLSSTGGLAMRSRWSTVSGPMRCCERSPRWVTGRPPRPRLLKTRTVLAFQVYSPPPQWWTGSSATTPEESLAQLAAGTWLSRLARRPPTCWWRRCSMVAIAIRRTSALSAWGSPTTHVGSETTSLTDGRSLARPWVMPTRAA